VGVHEAAYLVFCEYCRPTGHRSNSIWHPRARQKRSQQFMIVVGANGGRGVIRISIRIESILERIEETEGDIRFDFGHFGLGLVNKFHLNRWQNNDLIPWNKDSLG
jgi:hypothetical protein